MYSWCQANKPQIIILSIDLDVYWQRSQIMRFQSLDFKSVQLLINWLNYIIFKNMHAFVDSLLLNRVKCKFSWKIIIKNISDKFTCICLLYFLTMHNRIGFQPGADHNKKNVFDLFLQTQFLFKLFHGFESGNCCHGMKPKLSIVLLKTSASENYCSSTRCSYMI